MTVARLPADVLADRAALEARIAEGRPFVVTGGVGGALAAAVSSIERLVELFGDHVVRVSSRTFYLPFSTQQARVRDYVREVASAPSEPTSADEPIPYVFHDDLGQDARRQGAGATDTPFQIAQICPLPDMFGQVFYGKRLAAIRIGLGPRSSHAGVHTHGTAINLSVFGRKRWWLYPAQIGEAQTKRLHALIGGARVPSPQLFWLEHFHPLALGVDGDVVGALREKAESLAARGLYEIPAGETWTTPFLAEDLRGIETTQDTGDLVYVPERWPHAIINDAWSLSVIYELALERR